MMGNKLNIGLLIPILFLAMMGLDANGSDNLVLNGSFDDLDGDGRPIHWSGPKFGSDTGVADDKSVKFQSSLTQEGRIPIKSGHWYQFSCWLKIKDLADGVVRLRMTSKEVVKGKERHNSVLYQEIFTGDKWSKFETIFYASFGLEESIRLNFSVGSGESFAWVDDVNLVEVPEPILEFTNRIPPADSGNLVPNASFECGADGWSTLSDRVAWGPGLSGLVGEIVSCQAPHGNKAFRIDFGPGKTPVTTFNLFPAGILVHHKLLTANDGWLEVEKGGVYTVSAYMRADKVGVPVKLMVRFASPLAYPVDRLNDEPYEYPFHRYPRYAWLTTGWKRYSVSFRAEGRYAFVGVGADVSKFSDEPVTVWMDAVQLNKSENLHPFELREPVEIGFNSGKFGNIFYKGDEVKLNIQAFNSNSTDSEVDLRLRVEDFFDQLVLDSSRKLDVPAGKPLEVDWPLDLADTGFYRIKADWQANGSGHSKTIRMCVIEPYAHTDSPFGVNHAPPDSRICRTLRNAGIVWARDWGIIWQHLEPEPGTYSIENLEILDAHIDRVLESGMLVLSMCPTWPSSDWASEATEDVERRWEAHSRIWWKQAYAPEDLTAFKSFVETVVNRYKDKVHYWEYLNEPLGRAITLPRGAPSFANYTVHDYVRLLKAQYETVKKADPGATVIGGLGHRPAGTKKFCDADGLKYVDCINVHIYPGKARPEIFIKPMEKMLKDMDATGLGRKPIWMTEYAYVGTDELPWEPYALGPMEWQPSLLPDEKTLSAYSVRFAAIMFSHGVKKIFYHYGGAMCSEVNDSEEVLQSGVLVHGGIPRKFYVAQSHLANLLGPSFDYAGELSKLTAPDAKGLVDAYGYVFQSGPKAVLIAWAVEDSESNWTFKFDDDSLKEKTDFYDLAGKKLKKEQVKLTGFPVYLVSNELSASELVNKCRLLQKK